MPFESDLPAFMSENTWEAQSEFAVTSLDVCYILAHEGTQTGR